MVKAFPDREKARQAFGRAAAKAASSDPLPAEWIDLVERFGDMRTKGYIVALGNALLAKATDERIDPLALQIDVPVRPGRRGFSARTFASQVLVKEGRKIGLDVGLPGDEPLQGNPFTDEERLHRKLPVRQPAELDALVSALEGIDKMSSLEAEIAFAAYVRVRTNVAGPTAIPLPVTNPPLPALIAAAQAWAYEYSERGRIGQALIAGALDTVMDGVVTSSVYASSKKRPGDVRHQSPAGTDLAVEVKQKPVDGGQVEAFAKALAAAGVGRGFYAAIAKGQKELPARALVDTALTAGVAFAVYTSPTDFLAAAASLAPSLDDFVAGLPETVMKRLLELGATDEARQAWADAVSAATGA